MARRVTYALLSTPTHTHVATRSALRGRPGLSLMISVQTLKSSTHQLVGEIETWDGATWPLHCVPLRPCRKEKIQADGLLDGAPWGLWSQWSVPVYVRVTGVIFTEKLNSTRVIAHWSVDEYSSRLRFKKKSTARGWHTDTAAYWSSCVAIVARRPPPTGHGSRPRRRQLARRAPNKRCYVYVLSAPFKRALRFVLFALFSLLNTLSPWFHNIWTAHNSMRCWTMRIVPA
jgi:hypothetical protein